MWVSRRMPCEAKVEYAVAMSIVCGEAYPRTFWTRARCSGVFNPSVFSG